MRVRAELVVKESLVCLMLFVFLSAGNTRAQDDENKPTPKFTLSRETTFLTAPIKKNRFVDYAAGINQQLKKGITAKDNAAVELYKALGPKPENCKLPDKFFAEIGMERPPERGEYLKSLFELVDKSKMTEAQVDQLYKVQFLTMKQPWQSQRYSRIAYWLANNQIPLKHFRLASQRSKYYSPIIVDTEEPHDPGLLMLALLPGPQESRDGARLLCSQAMLSLGQRRVNDAWSDLLACKRLGRLIGQGPTIIESLIGTAIEGLSHEAMVTLIRESSLTHQQINQFREQLKAVPPISPLHKKIDLTERCMVLDALGAIARRSTSDLESLELSMEMSKLAKIVATFDLKIDLDTAYRVCNQKANRLTKIMETPDFEERCKLLQQFKKEEAALIERMKDLRADKGLAPEHLEKTFSKLMAEIAVIVSDSGASAANQAIQRIKQNEILFDTALGLSAFATEFGKFPNELSELKPNHLPNKPIDLYTGESLIYKRNGPGYLLYSVGPNKRDEMGRSYDDEPQGDDLIIRTERPKRRAIKRKKP